MERGEGIDEDLIEHLEKNNSSNDKNNFFKKHQKIRNVKVKHKIHSYND